MKCRTVEYIDDNGNKLYIDVWDKEEVERLQLLCEKYQEELRNKRKFKYKFITFFKTLINKFHIINN